MGGVEKTGNRSLPPGSGTSYFPPLGFSFFQPIYKQKTPAVERCEKEPEGKDEVLRESILDYKRRWMES